MSEAANVELIKRLYQAMGQATPDAALALLTEDVEFVVPGTPGVGAAGTGRGHAGVLQCLRTLRDVQDNQSVAMRQFVAEADTVVTLLHVTTKVRSTGKLFESDIVHFFTVRDGKVARLLDFFDTAALSEAFRS